MKRLAFALLSVMLLSIAAINASAQESRQVSDFNAVASAGPFNVHIKLDGTESVKVDADANILSEIETVVENNTLKIRFKDHENWRHHDIQKAEVYVTAKSLKALTNAGSGSIEVNGTISAGDIKIVLSGSGSISTAVKSDALRAVLTGSGSIKLNGSAGEADIHISGSGRVDANDLKTESSQIMITGSGDVRLIAEKSITAHITGSGNVTYTGNATDIVTRYTGSGRVTKAD